MPLQDHIHLWLTTDTISDEADHDSKAFPVVGPTSGLVEVPTKYIVHQRALTGKSHIHRNVDGGGDPVLYRDLNHILGMLTETQYNTLVTISGEQCYYLPVDHPDYVDGSEHNGASERYEVIFLPIAGVKPVDPSIQYRVLQVRLEEVT